MSLSRAARLALKLAKRKKYYKKELSSLHTKLRARGKKTEAKFKFKQKPKTGGGSESVTTAGTRYGIGAREHKVQKRGIQLIRRRWGRIWPHERESWRGEMDRMYGGIHMAQDPKRAKKSIKLLVKNYNKRFKKKKIIKKFFKLYWYTLELKESEKYNLLFFSSIAGPLDTLNFLSTTSKLFFVRYPKYPRSSVSFRWHKPIHNLFLVIVPSLYEILSLIHI